MMTCDRLRREKAPRAPVRSAIAPQRLQRKLAVGSANDPLEHEADRVADTITRMPDEHVQRVCTSCEEVELQRKSEEGGAPGVPAGFQSRFTALRGGGEPLPATTRSFFEPRFGRDFAGVRVHSGPEAGELARSVGALAFTVGESVVFGSGQYAPGTAAGRHLLAHELTHVAQQDGTPDTVRRAQIGHVTPAAGSSGAYFEYELDAAIKTYSQLSVHYGSSIKSISALNTGSAKSLHLGDRIKVPAIGVPAGPRPAGPGVASIIQNVKSDPVDLRWSGIAGANRIGRLSRGTSVSDISGTLDVPRSSISGAASGLLAEMVYLGLADATSTSGFVPAGSVRSLTAKVPATDIDRLARMLWGEQRGLGADAMIAAAWIAKNRYNAGWGTYNDILTLKQFHGIASAATVAAATGADAALWTDAQTIAKDVVDGKKPDPTRGYTFFGNGATVLASMKACAAKNPAFKWSTITGTNFHFSNLDYTGC